MVIMMVGVFVGCSPTSDPTRSPFAWATIVDDWAVREIYESGDSVVVRTDQQLHLVEASTGVTQWSADESATTNLVTDGQLLVVGIDDQLVVSNLADGSTVRRLEAGVGPILDLRPMPDGNVLVRGDNLAVCDPRLTRHSCRMLASGTSDHAIAKDDSVFVARRDRLSRIEARTGQVLWEFDAHGAIRGLPAVIDRTVLIASEDGNLYAIYVDDGTLRWSFAPSRPPLRPLAAGENVFIETDDRHVYAVTTATGSMRWRREYASSIAGLGATTDGLWVATQPGQIELLDSSWGEPSAATNLDASISCPPAVGATQAYVGSVSGALFAFYDPD